MFASRTAGVRLAALVDSILLLPATVFVAAAVLRLLQPREFEPARTSWVIFDWTVKHVPDVGAAALFTGLPGLALLFGCAALLWSWRRDQDLRHDGAAALAIVWRQRVVVLLVAVTLLAAFLLAFAVGHMVTG
jgi:hypothetical protein